MALKELKEEEDVGVMCMLNERVLQRQEKEALDQGSWSTVNIRPMAALLLMRTAHHFPNSEILFLAIATLLAASDVKSTVR